MTDETELWASAVDATTWLKVQNKDGTEREVHLSRRGQKTRISVADRERMTEMIVAPEFNPFTNGTLIQIGADGKPLDDTGESLSDEFLLTKVLTLRGAVLADRLRDFGEVVLRRLLALAEAEDLPNSVAVAVRDLITERYSVGGVSSLYKEMATAGDVATSRLG